jgi:hypothetical protein
VRRPRGGVRSLPTADRGLPGGRTFAIFSGNSMVFEDGEWPDLGRDIKALFGFVQGFLGSSSRNSKKMLAPLKTRNMFRGDN